MSPLFSFFILAFLPPISCFYNILLDIHLSLSISITACSTQLTIKCSSSKPVFFGGPRACRRAHKDKFYLRPVSTIKAISLQTKSGWGCLCGIWRIKTLKLMLHRKVTNTEIFSGPAFSTAIFTTKCTNSNGPAGQCAQASCSNLA